MIAPWFGLVFVGVRGVYCDLFLAGGKKGRLAWFGFAGLVFLAWFCWFGFAV